MRLTGDIFIAFEKAGISDELVPVFFLIEGIMRSNEDGRAPFAYRKLSEKFKLPERRIRKALREFVRAGFWITETASRQYTMVRRVPKRVSRTTSQMISAKQSKNSIKLNKSVSPTISQSDATGVSCSGVVSSAFDVVDSGLKKVVRHGSERFAPSPADQQRIDKETTWVREVLFKDCPLYQSDVKLNMIDERGSPWGLTLHRSWKSAYPAVDVMAEIKRAHVWELSNKERRKKNRARFLSNWLAKEQERGGIFKNGPVTRDRKPERRFDADMPRELPTAIPSRSDPSDTEYEVNRQAILVEIEARKAREREELPV